MNSAHTKTLFLDFDGVLHPYVSARDELFMHVANFERVMAQFPDWQIVISSAWRRYEALEELRLHFSPEMAQRIVDTTPMWYDITDITMANAAIQREIECRHWMQTHGLSEQPWLAVDDWPSLFTAQCPNLLLIDSNTGLDDAHAERLIERLREI